MKRYFLPLFIGSILIGAGIVLSVFEFSFFSYSNNLPNNNFEVKEEETYYSIEHKGLYVRVTGNNYHVIKDETLNNQAKVTFSYYPDFITLNRVENETMSHREVRLRFGIAHNSGAFYHQLFDLFASDLKNKELHNYVSFFQPYIEISVNPNEMSRVKIIRY